MLSGLNIDNACWPPVPWCIFIVADQVLIVVILFRFESSIVSFDLQQGLVIFYRYLRGRIVVVCGDGVLYVLNIIAQCFAELLQLNLAMVNIMESAVYCRSLNSREDGDHSATLSQWWVNSLLLKGMIERCNAWKDLIDVTRISRPSHAAQ